MKTFCVLGLMNFFFKRLELTEAIDYQYQKACADYLRQPTREQALLIAALATDLNDARYWWQEVRRAAIWIPKKET